MSDKITSFLIPMLEEEFFDRIRIIVRQELDAIIASETGNQVHHIEGMTSKPLYDMKEVRKLFHNVSRSTIYGWINAGVLKPRKMKGRVYFLWEDIQRQLSAHNS